MAVMITKDALEKSQGLGSISNKEIETDIGRDPDDYFAICYLESDAIWRGT